MKKILQYLFEHKTLSSDKAMEVLVNIGTGQYNEHEVTAFMTVFLMRSITLDELVGFRNALVELSVNPGLGGYDTMDIVGTGGDGKNTFNISTLACFIVAGAGQKVAKHGNYGASSVSGASNVMEQLGYRFSTDSDKLKRELDETNLCFLHAPLFHPALKLVGPIRRNLAIRTFFNMLGPIANPANPSCQLVGVFNLEMARIYNYYLQLNEGPFTIVHSLDGYDEISLTGDTKVITREGEFIRTPEELGRRMVMPADLFGGNTPQEAAELFIKILKGDGSWAQHAVVIANAAMALSGTGRFKNYEESYLTAVESFESGKAFAVHQKLMSLQ
jgi:anthranilate phosphoribosyltransferase